MRCRKSKLGDTGGCMYDGWMDVCNIVWWCGMIACIVCLLIRVSATLFFFLKFKLHVTHSNSKKVTAARHKQNKIKQKQSIANIVYGYGMIKSIKTFRHTHTPVARPDVANVYCNIFHFTFFQRFFCEPFFCCCC